MKKVAFCFAAVVALAAIPAAAGTMQADFDAAQALLDAGKRSEAVAAFTAVLARYPTGSQSRSANIVRARLGNALVDTGDAAAAEPLLGAAIAGLTGTTPADAEERVSARYDRARARDALGAHDSAAEDYGAVLAAKLFPPASAADISLRAALARNLTWSDPTEARHLVDGLLALPPEKFAGRKDSTALLQTLRGRIELNNGKPEDAKRWFTLAARSAGGQDTAKVNVADVQIRGDLALANFKLGDLDALQKNMAYSGAGSLVLEGLSLAASAPLPKCAPLSSLAPDAVAVVEFGIDDQGRAIGITPVYADRGSGAPAGKDEGPESLFAQAVARWSWQGADVKKLNPFWRQAVRVELRCFSDRPGRDPLRASFDGEFKAWANSLGIMAGAYEQGPDAAVLPAIRADLARRESAFGGTSPQLVPVLIDLAENVAASDADRKAAQARLIAVLVAAKAPPAIIDRRRLDEIGLASQAGPTRRAFARLARDRLQPMVAAQEGAGTDATRIGLATRLRLAEALDDNDERAAARAQFDRIVASAESLLPAADPIRTAALLNIANLAASTHDTDAAADALAATGLTPEQCSLIDTRPQPVNTSISSSVFPLEARRWRNGGLVRVGYDITADGRPVNVRTIVASPPFIYSAVTERSVARFQYRPVFRPGNSIGCTGKTQSIRFQFSE